MFKEIIKYLEDNYPKGEIIKKGAIHVGAHLAEELAFYETSGASEVLWIEANPQVFDVLVQKLCATPKAKVRHSMLNRCLSNESDQLVDFNITTKTQSSSMLPLKEHLKYYPDITVTDTIQVRTETFTSLAVNRLIEVENYDFLCIDVQGAELKVLEGFGAFLPGFDNICIEVNEDNLYDGCPLVADIDTHLEKWGFKRVVTIMTEAKWGEALYIKA